MSQEAVNISKNNWPPPPPEVSPPEAQEVVVRQLNVGNVGAVVLRQIQTLASSSIWLWVTPMLYLVCIFAFGHAWLQPGLPEGDLAGAVADLARWQHFVTHDQVWAAWDSTSFMGHPRSLVNLYSGMALAYAPFLLFFDSVMAVKVGMLFYMAMAGYSAFLLIRSLTANNLIGLILGLAYALHPIHLQLTFASSHANFPPFYMIQPLILWAVIVLCERPNIRIASLTAIVVASAGWIDLERVAVMMPGLVVLACVIVVCRSHSLRQQDPMLSKTWLRKLVAMGVLSVFLTVMVLAMLWLPAVVGRSGHALFSEASRESSRAFFSIQNLYYYIDPDGQMLNPIYQSLPGHLGHDASNFYLGLGTIVLVFIGILLPVSSHRRFRLFFGSVLALSVTLAASHGLYSGLQSWGNILDEIWLHIQSRNELGGRLLLVTVIVGLLFTSLTMVRFYLFRKTVSPWQVGLLLISLSILLFAKPFVWFLQYIPPFAEMRNPGWFATGLAPLVLLVACGLSLAAILQCVNKPAMKNLVMVGVVLLIGLDVYLYGDAFDKQLSNEYLQEMSIVGQRLQADPRDGRVLTRESYNPHADLIYVYSQRSTAWYWLNWMSPKKTNQVVMDEIYPILHRPETIDKALKLAGNTNIRFILYDLTQGPLPPQNQALKPLWAGKCLALYENLHCRPWAELGVSAGHIQDKNAGDSQSPSIQLDRNQPGNVKARIHASSPSVVLVRESWMPGWQGTLNDQPVKVSATAEAMLAIKVPEGDHELRLTYQDANTSQYAGGLSLTGILGIGCYLLLGMVQYWHQTSGLNQEKVVREGGQV